MKKTVLFLLIITCITSCNTNKKTEKISEEKNVESKIENEKKEEILLGNISCKDLEQGIYNTWFIENFNAHQLDSTTLEKVKPLLKDVSIKLFMGTWCEDSQREVPAMTKILEELNYPEEKLEIIAVSRDKDTPKGLEIGMNINYVPSIIFFKNEKEIGRIVESPVESLEKDMLSILSGKEYKHTYQE